MDYSLYLVTDAKLSRGRSQLEIIEAAVQGGVTMVQYREKNTNTRQMVEEALELSKLCRQLSVPFIVNDRVDVALAVDADGVHIGQEDMPASLVRKMIGPGKILGVSVDNIPQARAAIAAGADYVGAGAIFKTPTKTDISPPIGIQGLHKLARICTIPIVAIGGLNANNVEEVILAGAGGIAVVSAIVNADDVESAAHELKVIIENTNGARNGRK